MLKGAIIGAGKIAQTGHLPAYETEAIKKEVEIVAAVDISEASISIMKDKYPDIHLYNDFDSLLGKENIDFVDICVPPNLHREIIEKSVLYSLPVLCEKPITIGSKNAGYLHSLLNKDKIIFMPCHQYKYSPIWKEFKKLVDENNGNVKSILQFNVFRKQADPGINSWNPDWRINKKISGGGILADTGVHYIYLVLWMLGRVNNITTKTFSLKHNYNVEDTGIIMIESEKGIAQINLTWAADRRANNAQAVSDSGSIYYDGESMFIYRNDKEVIVPVPNVSDKSTYISLYVSLLKDFIYSIKNRIDCKNYIDEAFQSILVLDLCYESAKSNKTINLLTELWENELKPDSL